MTIDEFSYEFDVLATSYLHEGGFSVSDSSILAFNEYEKSVYLTREMESLVLGLYSDNSVMGSFERTEQLRRDLENLLCTMVLDEEETDFTHITSNSQFFRLALKLVNTETEEESFVNPIWFIVYEAGRYKKDGWKAGCEVDEKDFPVEIVPVTYDTLHRVKSDPFRGPSDRRALRLDSGKTVDNYVEIIPKYPLGKYYIKYIRRPRPIILTDLTSSGLTINGESLPNGCELHSSLHRLILDGAVRMAVSTRTGGSKPDENQ